MYALNDYEWGFYDDYHIERVKRYSYIKKMYFQLKYIFKNDLKSEYWDAVLKELKRVDSNNKRLKKDLKKKVFIDEIIKNSPKSIFNDERELLQKLDLKEIRRIYKNKSKKKGCKIEKVTVKKQLKNLEKSTELYQDFTLFNGYLQADTLRQYLEIRPNKLSINYFSKLLSKELNRETYLMIIQIINNSHKFIKSELQPVLDHCKEKSKP
jgi:hypothetical protein